MNISTNHTITLTKPAVLPQPLLEHQTDFQANLYDFLVTSWAYLNAEREEINVA